MCLQALFKSRLRAWAVNNIEDIMPHPSHDMNAYRNNDGHWPYVWVAYCKKCSAEQYHDLEKECPGEYVRKSTALVDSKMEQD
jgi:hypothetical protein